MSATPTRYSKTAISIHWISALLVLVLLGSGFRAGLSTDVATKSAALTIHVPVAITVLLLTLWRVIRWWRVDRKPDPIPGQPAWQETIATLTHRALYVVLFAMLGSGVALSVMSGLPLALFGDAPLPEFTEFAPRGPHGVFALALVGLVALHAGAALYHHVALRDRTLKRMWFGEK